MSARGHRDEGRPGHVKIRKVRPEELQAVLDLLRRAGLPVEGVETHFDGFLIAAEGDRILGAVGLESYDDVGLLRSLAVSRSRRSSGIGHQLVSHLLEEARSLGIRDVYLLTTTAEWYFPRFGFEAVDRSSADPRLRASGSFRTRVPTRPCACASR